MNEKDIELDINTVLESSPVMQQLKAAKKQRFEPKDDGQTTLVTGDIEGKTAEQIQDSAERGVEFSQEPSDVYTGGIALPKESYNTRRQTELDKGNPLYFKPNYQPVAPFDVKTPFGVVKSTTLDYHKLAWQVAIANGLRVDSDYTGYIYTPEKERSTGWSDFWYGVASAGGQLLTSVPKAAVNIASIPEKAPFYIPAIIQASAPEFFESTFGKNFKPQDYIDAVNGMVDAINGPIDEFNTALDTYYTADPTDNSFLARNLHGLGGVLYNFGVAGGLKSSTFVYGVLNTAESDNLRRQAINSGASPMMAEAYSVAIPAINTKLDTIEFEGFMRGWQLSKKGVAESLKELQKTGLIHGVKKYAKEMAVGGAGEILIEETQLGLENIYNEEFWKDPWDDMAITALTIGVLKAATLPVAVRHADVRNAMEVAKALGVEGQFKDVRNSIDGIVKDFVAKGIIDDKDAEKVKKWLISDAPDRAIKYLREAAEGALDKTTPQERNDFNKALAKLDENALTLKEYRLLDQKTDRALSATTMSNAEKDMVKGIMRGAASILMLEGKIKKPSDLKIPEIKYTDNPRGSSYNATTNTIEISTRWSDTEFTKRPGIGETNDRYNYNKYIRQGFIPSGAQSDMMSSLFHELAHWLDKQVGQKGYGDFFAHYYGAIQQVFGKDRANKVRKAAEKQGTRMPKTGLYTTKDTTENAAQAIARLGKRSAAFFGLGKSKAARFLSYANMMLNQMGTIDGYQEALKSVINENTETINSLIRSYGSEELKKAVKKFLQQSENPNEEFADYLIQQNMLKDLYKVMDSFADAATLAQVRPLFDSQEEIDNFIEYGDMYFNSGYDDAVAEVKERRAKKKEQAAQDQGVAPKPITASNEGKQVKLQDGTIVTLLPNGGIVKANGKLDFGGENGIDEVRKLLKPEDKKDDIRHEFIGVQADLPITQQLTKAQEMMVQKVDQEKIFRETGWFYDTKDKKWKYEIPSGEIAANKIGLYVETPNGEKKYRGANGYLKDYYINDELYKAYPILADMPIEFVPTREEGDKASGGTYYDENGKATDIQIMYDVNDPIDSAKHVLIHEVQHAIQAIEGFARGGDPTDYMNLSYIRYVYDTKGKEAGEKELKKQLDNAFPKYEALAGEVEARNVQLRAKVSDVVNQYGGSIKNASPLKTQDTKDSDAIVKFDDLEIDKYIPSEEQISDIEETAVYERIPNNYVVGTDPAAEIKDAYRQGEIKSEEPPSYTKEVDGRNLGEDIGLLRGGMLVRAKNIPNKIVKWAASSPWGWGLDRIITTMFGRDVSNKFDIAGKYTIRNSLRSGMYARFMQELAPIIGDVTKDKTSAMFKYKTMLNNLGFVRVKGVEVNDPYSSDVTTKRDLTGWEVMYVYLMQRMGTKYGNRIQQSTKTDINELIATLSDEEKAFADSMSKTLRDVWVDIVGEEKAVANYFPILDARHAALDEVNIDTFKERMETNSPIAIDDAGRIFSKDISRLASWKSGFYQTLKRLREALQYKGAEGQNIDPNIDDELKKNSALLAGHLSDVFGRDAYHNLLRLLDTQIADPQDQMLDSASSKTLQQMGNNVIKGMLSFKFLSLPKNLVNITMMWGGASDQSTYWNGFAEGIADKARTWKYMMEHSNEIRMRYNDAGYNEFLDQRNTGGSTAPLFKGISKIFAGLDWSGDKTGAMAKMSAALDMMGEAGLKMFMLNGDAVANIYGGYGLIKDYMKQGLSEEEAFKKLDRYIVEHQSSSNLTMKPLGQLQANKSLAGQFMAFTSEGVAKGASILGTFDEVKMGSATKSEAIANAMSVAMSMVLFTMLASGVWDLWDDDEKVREEAVNSLYGAMIDQLFGFNVLGNGFITPMVQNLIGVGGNGGISAPLWSFFTEGVTNLKRGEYDRLATKSMEATGMLVGANALYNDILGIMFLNSEDADVREAGFRMLGGRTPGYAEKRTGAQIRKQPKENVENEDEE